ncbi:AMP-binding protein [Brevibacterium yomogidense]|uniref:AMP-binding protein n=1 Tax=Brevibacterium yomogidense TaxID=946573 RepID=UPI0018E03DB5|nr:AMP-binding protein [Brevibacterium yomogidense]
MLNLGYYVSRAADYWAQREAVVAGDLRVSFAQLDSRSTALAGALAQTGAGRGTPVATYAANTGQLVEIEVALYKLSALRVPVNVRLGVAETAHILRDAGVLVLFTDVAHADAAREAAARAETSVRVVVISDDGPDGYDAFVASGEGTEPGTIMIDTDESDPCVLNFTSGSTGKLKAAIQTVGNRLANMRKRLMDPSGSAPEARYMVAGPITHASGMGILAALSRGTTIVVLPRWDPAEFLRIIRDERITSTFVVPTMLHSVLDHGVRQEDVQTLTTLKVGGAPVSPQRLREAVAAFGPIVEQGYGQAETTSGVTALTKEDVVRGIEEDPEILLSCGRAVFDSEVAVLDDDGNRVPAGELGELAVRGPDCVTEYWGAPELTEETFRDGWVLTGDIARIRDDGYVFIVDRKKDMIISGGFNIYSTEVEAAIYEHPDVHEVCVVGSPDPKWGERVTAVVVPRADSSPSADSIADFCEQRLDRFKRPRRVDFVTELPVNRNGKIDRKQVRAGYWAGAERAV